jgi:hypothetical protein
MFKFLKEIYFTAFTIFFKVGGAAWTPGINAGKGVTGVTMIEWALFVGVWSWIDVLDKTNTFTAVPKLAVIIAFFALWIANCYPLVVLGYGITFEREFNQLKKSKKMSLVAGFLTVLLVVTSFFLRATSAHRELIRHEHLALSSAFATGLNRSEQFQTANKITTRNHTPNRSDASVGRAWITVQNQLYC